MWPRAEVRTSGHTLNPVLDLPRTPTETLQPVDESSTLLFLSETRVDCPDAARSFHWSCGPGWITGVHLLSPNRESGPAVGHYNGSQHSRHRQDQYTDWEAVCLCVPTGPSISPFRETTAVCPCTCVLMDQPTHCVDSGRTLSSSQLLGWIYRCAPLFLPLTIHLINFIHLFNFYCKNVPEHKKCPSSF